jgi:ATP-binding cassette subfamily B protein
MSLFRIRFRRKRVELPPLLPAAARLEGDEDDANFKPIQWPLVWRFLQQLRPHRRTYLLGMGLGVIMIASDFCWPRFLQYLVDYVQRFLTGKLPGVSENEAIRWLIIVCALWSLQIVGARLLERAVILLMTGAGEKVQFELRRRLFEKLQQLSMDYYDRTKLGRIISRLTSDVNSMREMSVWLLWRVVANCLAIVAAAIMLYFTQWKLFLALVWLGPILYFTNEFFRRRIGYRWQVVREWFTQVSSNMAENITGVRVVMAFNRQMQNLSHFNWMQERNTRNNVQAARLNGVFGPVLQLIGFVGKVTILGYGAYLISTGEITKLGLIIAAYMYWDWFMNPIIDMGNLVNQLMQAMAGAERVFSLLDQQPAIRDIPGALALPRLRGEVVFQNVTFGYKPERPVLHDVSFTARPGEMIALVGHTGSGKSSIISLLSRFYLPQKGRILVDGHDIREVTDESLHRQMGLVLQTNYLFSGTVMDNIRYARPAATDEEVVAAARALGTHEAILQLQQGYTTQVGERGASMSLGQRQLICFTRAFLADPRLFMLDEATSAVDTETELLLQHSLEKLLQGRTTFVVAHRLSTIKRASCILVIDQGRIIERGSHEELLQTGGKYAELYEQFVSEYEEVGASA